MHSIEDLIRELESHIAEYELINISVSKGSVGWHIEHSLLTMDVIIEALKKSDPNEYRGSFNSRRFFVFTMNKIPRGVAEDPASVRPNSSFNFESLQNHISVTSRNLKALEHLQRNHFFSHPFLGRINLEGAKKFIQIHTRHHIDIINDIIRTKR